MCFVNCCLLLCVFCVLCSFSVAAVHLDVHLCVVCCLSVCGGSLFLVASLQFCSYVFLCVDVTHCRHGLDRRLPLACLYRCFDTQILWKSISQSDTNTDIYVHAVCISL